MKKIILIFFALLFINCDSKEEKKKGFEYNRTQKIDKKSNDKNGSKALVDLDNGLAKLWYAVKDNNNKLARNRI